MSMKREGMIKVSGSVALALSSASGKDDGVEAALAGVEPTPNLSAGDEFRKVTPAHAASTRESGE
jgi:hypothetical protein